MTILSGMINRYDLRTFQYTATQECNESTEKQKRIAGYGHYGHFPRTRLALSFAHLTLEAGSLF